MTNDTQTAQYTIDAVSHVLTVKATPELLARLQGDVYKLLAAYERNSGNSAIKRAAALAANSVTISRKEA